MKDNCKITMVQLKNSGDAKDNVSRMEKYFIEASEYGSDIVVFPEYVLGHNIKIDHDNVKYFLSLCKKYSIYGIAGLVENFESKWTTTAIIVDRNGLILDRYFKTHPASGPGPNFWPPIEGYDGEARGILGNQFKVFTLDFAKIGIIQCYDGYFPEAWGCTSYNGAEIIFWINGRDGMVEDSYCITAAECYDCLVGANISNGKNTGFAACDGSVIDAEGEREEMRLFPRIKNQGDGSVSASIDLKKLRYKRKHSRRIHQRRPELYTRLTEDIKIWQDYPDIKWDSDECIDFVNKSQL